MTTNSAAVARFVFAASCLIILSVHQLTANEPVSRPYNLDADLELLLPDTIVVGDTFRVTFNVKIKQPITHYNDVPDKVVILLPPCCVLDSGQTEWHGRLEEGSVVSLVLRARAVHGCYEFFQGFVSASCSVSHSNLFKTRGRITSRYYRILGPPEPVSGQPDSLSIRVIDTYDSGPPPSVTGVHPRTTAVPDSQGKLWETPPLSDSLKRPVDSTIHRQPRHYRPVPPRNNQRLSMDSLRLIEAVINYVDSVENWLYVVQDMKSDASRRDSRLPYLCKSLTQGLVVERAQDRTCKITMEDGLYEGKIEIRVGTDTFVVTAKQRQ